jgi:trimeric autotransporter adhesin
LKQNVQPFPDGWNLLQNLDPVWFEYNGEAGTHKGEKAVGTIAQDMKEIAPYMVSEVDYKDAKNNSSAYLGVNYHALFFILTNVVKDQNNKIEKLEREVEALKAVARKYYSR